MFTGIVEEIGTIRQMRRQSVSAQLTISAKRILEDVQVGDSIAVNGICLTVTDFTKDHFTVDVMHETLRRSSIGQAISGTRVNLERAMAANGRFGGHMVSGHIDGTGTICDIKEDGNAISYTIAASKEILDGIVQKGSVAVDGISLTIANRKPDCFQVSIIPHTRGNTILGERKKGDTVNLETDCIGKYVRQFLEQENKKSNITWSMLVENGF